MKSWELWSLSSVEESNFVPYLSLFFLFERATKSGFELFATVKAERIYRPILPGLVRGLGRFSSGFAGLAKVLSGFAVVFLGFVAHVWDASTHRTAQIRLVSENDTSPRTRGAGGPSLRPLYLGANFFLTTQDLCSMTRERTSLILGRGRDQGEVQARVKR